MTEKEAIELENKELQDIADFYGLYTLQDIQEEWELNGKLKSENSELKVQLEKTNEQIDYQKNVIKMQLETINELQKYRDAIDAIASVCDLVLCGATNWDEEQLDEHFEHVYQIIKRTRENFKGDREVTK